jgi:hypothetical protein
MKKSSGPSGGTRKIGVEVHRRKREFLNAFREFARNRDEEGFKTYLTDDCGIKPGDAAYPQAMREFWNLVRAIENEQRQ